MNIGGFQKFSLIDYPCKISAIVFTQGCDFRCPYCHNPELISHKEGCIDEDEIIEFLRTRIGKLDAVVITGGEPCLQSDLLEFMQKIKMLGFLVKLDTNGSNPDVIKSALEDELVDYIAMDIKAPIQKYSSVTGIKTNKKTILKSIKIIMNSGINYEFRTTAVKNLLDVNDFKEISKILNGAKAYYLQKFIPSKHLDPFYKNRESFSDEEFKKIKNIMLCGVQNCFLR
jgi:pyruvate formate lyase activating enzyme